MDSKTDLSNEEIKANVLRRLYRKRKWNAAHTAFENLYRNCPKNLAGMYKKNSVVAGKRRLPHY